MKGGKVRMSTCSSETTTKTVLQESRGEQKVAYKRSKREKLSATHVFTSY